MDDFDRLSDPKEPPPGRWLLETCGEGFFDLLGDEGGLFVLAVIAIGFVLYILIGIVFEPWSNPPPPPFS